MIRIFQLFIVKNSKRFFLKGIFCNFASLYPPNNKNRHPLSLQKILRMNKIAEHPKDSQTKWKRKKKSIWKQFLAEICTNFLFMNCEFIFISNPSVYVLRIINEKSFCNSPCGCRIKIKLSRASLYRHKNMHMWNA